MFLGCFSPPLQHNFDHRELICVETAFQKWDFSFLIWDGGGGGQITDSATNCISNGPPNCASLLSSEEGGHKFRLSPCSFMKNYFEIVGKNKYLPSCWALEKTDATPILCLELA